MTLSRTLFALSLAAVAALALGGAAEGGSRGRGGPNSERAKDLVVFEPAGSVEFREAKLKVERKDLRRQSIRLEIEGAPSGLDLAVFLADEGVALVRVAAMREEGDSGEYDWRVRTQKGDALPFGVADVADLSGRAIEVRTSADEVVLQGAMPTLQRATGLFERTRSLRTGLAVDDDFDDAEANILVHRHPGGEEMHVIVEDAPAGLALTAWIRDQDGNFTEIGALAERPEHGDDDDDDATDDDDSTYELTLGAATGLPLDAQSLADLAGLLIEVRTADGAVLASGFVPDVSTPDADDDDDDDRPGRGRGRGRGHGDAGDEDEDGDDDSDGG